MTELCTQARRQKAGVFLLVLSLVSCGGPNLIRLEPYLTGSNCHQQAYYPYAADGMPQPVHHLNLNPALTERFSFNSLNVANALNLLESIEKYVASVDKYQDNPTVEHRLTMLELAQTIHQRVNLALLEISATVSEIDCEEERADQVGTFLKLKEDDTRTKLTVAAIAVGAIGAIVTGFLLTQSNADNDIEYIGISTGITEALLGFSILQHQREIEFQHPRNPLRDIWEGKPTSEIFPPSVWYYLNYDDPSRPDTPSLRNQIIAQWRSFGQIADVKPQDKDTHIDLYFGEGGIYSAEQLKNRANMHDQLEAQINLMKQDLKNLVIEIDFLSTPNPMR
jgi:hypothetical protein